MSRVLELNVVVGFGLLKVWALSVLGDSRCTMFISICISLSLYIYIYILSSSWKRPVFFVLFICLMVSIGETAAVL